MKRFRICAGAAVLEPHSSRGCAFGDFNNDGNVDVLILNMSEPPSLLHNQNQQRQSLAEREAAGHALEPLRHRRACGGHRRRAPPDSRGAERVELYFAERSAATLSASGRRKRADQIEVRWPSGHIERLPGVDADQFIVVEEGRGIR